MAPSGPLGVTMRREPLEALPATFFVSKKVQEIATEAWHATDPIIVPRPVPSMYDEYEGGCGLQRPIIYNPALDICFVDFECGMWHFPSWNFEDFWYKDKFFLENLQVL
jgi:hypothetical protein